MSAPSPRRPLARVARGGRPASLVKMSGLARLSGVPAATIKHYLREGLLPAPDHKNRNVAYYDPALAERIRRIKELQRSRFLPLKVIREVLDADALPSRDDALGTAIARVLSERPATERRTRPELIASGMPEAELDWLEGIGLLSPADGTYAGDDLELLRVLGASRRAGITAEMLPVTVLAEYADAMRRLVRAELRLFREGVLPRAGRDLDDLATAATTLSERLLVLIRRKLLLPTLSEAVRDERARTASPPRRATARAAPSALKSRTKRRTS